MKQQTTLPLYILIAVFLAVIVFSILSCNVKEVCPECGMENCIYQQIDKTCDEGTDTDIMNAIYKVCGQRGIKDSTTINLIKANYYL